MFRFDQLVRRDMTVSDVKQRYPATIRVFEQFGFRPVCDDCDIGTAARRGGINVADVLGALNNAAFGPQMERDEGPDN